MKKIIFSLLLAASINANAACTNDSIPYNSAYSVKYAATGFVGAGTAWFYGYIHTTIFNFYKMHYSGLHNGISLEAPYMTTYTISPDCTLRFTFYRKLPLRNISVTAKVVTNISKFSGTITDGIKIAPVMLIRK